MADDGTGTAGDRPPVGQLGYTEASRELDGIVRFFEQREVDVDQLVDRLERATAIVDELDRRLRQTRVQVEELVPRLAAVLSADGAADAPDEHRPGPGDRPANDRPANDRPANDRPANDRPANGGTVGAVPDEEELEQETEDELDEADQLVEVMEDGVEAMIADDGDPGPTEPQGLF